MNFTQTKLKGCFFIEAVQHIDERGFFARTYCRHEFSEQGIEFDFVQCNTVVNSRKGTLRGMHYAYGSAESKLVRCTKGKVFDVAVDLRPDSATFLEWVGYELNDKDQAMLFIPPDFAHGYISLVDNAELFYQMGDFYEPTVARGFRWNDPTVSIDWPMEPLVVSERDATLPYVTDLKLISPQALE
ncbi:MAG: dTDP-4-dehydrorhamnose 3,5-epimerase [Candidatus Obscuribacterales bacterium]|nr:dTDP-4-dehydrorhamnose 3,5-epimerase [Candidatus Obscuribacterales bacterium]